MEYTLAYDISNESMKYFWLLPVLIVLIFLGVIIHKALKREKGWGTEVAKLSFVILFLSAWGYIVGTHEISGYKEVQRILDQKEYQIVEGVVENFDPMPYSGRKNESFTVNDVKFKYSDYDESFYGLNNTKSHGGPISGNGQKVKIEYYSKKGRNYILKLMIEK